MRTRAGADDGEGQRGGQSGERPEPVGNVKEDVEAYSGFMSVVSGAELR